MGGTFNPVHAAHLALAEWVRDALKLDEIWFIPTGSSYMKDSRDILPGEERLRMVELAIQDNPFFRCLDLEVAREGYTYSYETLEQLNAAYPENSFYFITGADCLFTIDRWKNPERIFGNCTLERRCISGSDGGQKKRVGEEVLLQRGDTIDSLSPVVCLFHTDTPPYSSGAQHPIPGAGQGNLIYRRKGLLP